MISSFAIIALYGKAFTPMLREPWSRHCLTVQVNSDHRYGKVRTDLRDFTEQQMLQMTRMKHKFCTQ